MTVKKPVAPIADIVMIEHDENEPMPIEGPDLVLSHKLLNAPKSLREEILRRAKSGEPEEEKPSTPVKEHLIDPIYPKEAATPAEGDAQKAEEAAVPEQSAPDVPDAANESETKPEADA